ncbi:MAG: sugar phosphate isomerase/epimerase family protein [Armatimonadota bacterium]
MIRLAYHPASYLRQNVCANDAIADIADSGWDGFEWSSGAVQEHFDGPGECRDYLEAVGVELSGIYHTCRFENDAQIQQWLAEGAKTIEFANSIGTEVLMIDGGSTELPADSSSVERVAEAAEQLGLMACDAGMICTWHQHWGTLFQYEDEFAALMDATDPALLKCTLDTAHLALGGFDIPATFERYADRIRYVHLKDLDGERRFADLERGTVDLEAPAQILLEHGFEGWAVCDLDYTDRDPRESSRHNFRTIKKLLGR